MAVPPRASGRAAAAAASVGVGAAAVVGAAGAAVLLLLLCCFCGDCLHAAPYDTAAATASDFLRAPITSSPPLDFTTSASAPSPVGAPPALSRLMYIPPVYRVRTGVATTIIYSPPRRPRAVPHAAPNLRPDPAHSSVLRVPFYLLRDPRPRGPPFFYFFILLFFSSRFFFFFPSLGVLSSPLASVSVFFPPNFPQRISLPPARQKEKYLERGPLDTTSARETAGRRAHG